MWERERARPLCNSTRLLRPYFKPLGIPPFLLRKALCANAAPPRETGLWPDTWAYQAAVCTHTFRSARYNMEMHKHTNTRAPLMCVTHESFMPAHPHWHAQFFMKHAVLFIWAAGVELVGCCTNLIGRAGFCCRIQESRKKDLTSLLMANSNIPTLFLFTIAGLAIVFLLCWKRAFVPVS